MDSHLCALLVAERSENVKKGGGSSMVQHLPGMSEALNSYTWGPHFTNEDHGLARGCQRGHVSHPELESQSSGDSHPS